MATPCGKGEYLPASSSSSSSTSSSSFTSGDSSSSVRSSATTTEPTSLTVRELEDITDNFSEERVLGQGTYGKVYKGRRNGDEIAVKMLYTDIKAIDNENFQHEFTNLMMLDHKNIVRLVAYCYETRYKHMDFKGRIVFPEMTYKALCFEYMGMGSLQRHLSDETQGLDWQTRYKIIKGTCEGLKYLHEELKEPIYHLDLKPDNILLDMNMEPKLADFGLSKLFTEEQTRVTQSFSGTLGYMPPEYVNGQVVSKKFDIFSLGVVITKIISGRRGHTRSVEMPLQKFLDQVNHNWKNKLKETCTSQKTLEANCEQVSICMEIGLRCMHEDRYKRPSIVDIIDILDVTESMIKKGTTLRRLLSNTTLDDIRRAKVPPSNFSEGPAKLFYRQTVDNALRSVDSCEVDELIKADISPRGSRRDIPDRLLESIVTMYDDETEKYDPNVRDSERQYMIEKLKKEIHWRKEAEQAWKRSHETVEELVKKLEETTKEKPNAKEDAEMMRQFEKQVNEESEYTRQIPTKEHKHTDKLLAEKEEHVSKTLKSGIFQYMMEGEWS